MAWPRQLILKYDTKNTIHKAKECLVSLLATQQKLLKNQQDINSFQHLLCCEAAHQQWFSTIPKSSRRAQIVSLTVVLGPRPATQLSLQNMKQGSQQEEEASIQIWTVPDNCRIRLHWHYDVNIDMMKINRTLEDVNTLCCLYLSRIAITDEHFLLSCNSCMAMMQSLSSEAL